MVEDKQFWLNFAAFLGIALLAIPVLTLDNRKKKLFQIEDAIADNPNDFENRVREILIEKRSKNVSNWRWTDRFCLWVGYLLLLGSSFCRLM